MPRLVQSSSFNPCFYFSKEGFGDLSNLVTYGAIETKEVGIDDEQQRSLCCADFFLSFFRELFHNQVLGVWINVFGTLISYFFLSLPPSLKISSIFQLTGTIFPPLYQIFCYQKFIKSKEEGEGFCFRKSTKCILYCVHQVSLAALINASGNLIVVFGLGLSWSPLSSVLYISLGSILPTIYFKCIVPKCDKRCWLCHTIQLEI